MENLLKYSKIYDLNLQKNQIEKFDTFYNFLIEENQKYNLTAITDKNEFISKHIIDCLLPHYLFKENSKVVDIGSGAGFPAIPLKILRDDLDITMLDSVNKKTTFCNMAVEKLGLKNIRAEHTRIEDFAKKSFEKFDVCTSRAVANMQTLLEYALPLVKVGGVCILYKSQKLEEELSLSKNALNVLGGKVEKIEKYVLNENERNVVIIKKVKTCPKNYPRGQNKPRIKPL